MTKQDPNTCTLCDAPLQGHFFTDVTLPGRYCTWGCLAIAKDAHAPRRKADHRAVRIHNAGLRTAEA